MAFRALQSALPCGAGSATCFSRAHPVRFAGVGLAGLLAAAGPALGQNTLVNVDSAEFQVEPDGTLLATIREGVPVRPGETRDGWRSATIEGWIWAESVEPDERPSHDLRVAVSGGENLRAEPNGRILARLRTGMLLDSLDQRGAWVRVRRTAWLRRAVLGVGGPDGDADAAAVAVAPETAAAAPDGRQRIGGGGAVVAASPDGETVGRLGPATRVDVLSREGQWARVRVEGWVRVSDVGADSDTGAVSTDATPAALSADPDAFRGRLVEWTVQFIALDTAGAIRTDLREGEPFILARPPGDDTRFVYIAVPPGLLDEVERLSPLQNVTVLGRVRSGRSALMDAPVLELVRIG